jgi:hypothetical protein
MRTYTSCRTAVGIPTAKAVFPSFVKWPPSSAFEVTGGSGDASELVFLLIAMLGRGSMSDHMRGRNRRSYLERMNLRGSDDMHVTGRFTDVDPVDKVVFGIRGKNLGSNPFL